MGGNETREFRVQVRHGFAGARFEVHGELSPASATALAQALNAAARRHAGAVGFDLRGCQGGWGGSGSGAGR